MTTGLREAR